MAAIDALSARNRVAVLLFYFEQQTVSEIAGVLAISTAAVKSRLHKARRQL